MLITPAQIPTLPCRIESIGLAIAIDICQTYWLLILVILPTARIILSLLFAIEQTLSFDKPARSIPTQCGLTVNWRNVIQRLLRSRIIQIINALCLCHRTRKTQLTYQPNLRIHIHPRYIPNGNVLYLIHRRQTTIIYQRILPI